MATSKNRLACCVNYFLRKNIRTVHFLTQLLRLHISRNLVTHNCTVSTNDYIKY